MLFKKGCNHLKLFLRESLGNCYYRAVTRGDKSVGWYNKENIRTCAFLYKYVRKVKAKVSEQKLTLTCYLSCGTSHSNDRLCGQHGDGEKKTHKKTQTNVDEHKKLMEWQPWIQNRWITNANDSTQHVLYYETRKKGYKDIWLGRVQADAEVKLSWHFICYYYIIT